MRLPQSFSQLLSRASFAILLTALVTVRSFGAQAATEQLTCTPPSLTFGAVEVGKTETQLITLRNSGSTSVTVTAMNISGTGFSVPQVTLPFTLFAGESTSFSVTFAPSAAVWTGGKVVFVSNASNPDLRVVVGGGGETGENATASPSSVSFGAVAVGASSSQTVVLTNSRPWKITLSSVNTWGSGFSVSGLATPMTLSAGQSVSVKVTFTPELSGVASGGIFVSGPQLNVPFSGTGTAAAGQLTVTPANVNFGNVPIGTTQKQMITMGASGTSVTVSSDSINNAQFVLEGATFPLTIPAGQSASFNLAFTPTSSGAKSGSLSFSSNASNSQVIEALTGDGTTTQYSVGLSWNSTSGVAGYNVYRSSSATGTYAKLNATPNANTAYMDSTVVSGQTYYYAATSVSSSGQESAHSSPVQASVP